MIDLIDRHLKIAHGIIDARDGFPEMRSDEFWKSIHHLDDGKRMLVDNKNIKQMDNHEKTMQEFVIDGTNKTRVEKTSFLTETEIRDMGK